MAIDPWKLTNVLSQSCFLVMLSEAPMKTAATRNVETNKTQNSTGDRTGDHLGSQINISIFLGLIFLTVFVMPSIGLGDRHEKWYGNIVFSILIGSGTVIAWPRRGLFLFSTAVGLITLAVRWMALWMPTRAWERCSEVATLGAVLMISWILVLHIFRRARPITAVSIQAAIAVYLLFGLGWANAYLLVIQRNPHSFHSTVGLSSSSSTEWYYYSYVTLTTLGYGEITPLTRVARTLAVGEAVTGQLYLAVLIARLIGMEIISSRENLAQDSD
jgi:voltage-gated potassium channel Kch